MMKKIMLCLFGVMAVSVLTMRAVNGQPPPAERVCKSGDYTFTLSRVLKVRDFIPAKDDKVYMVVMVNATSLEKVLSYGSVKVLGATDSTGADLRIAGDPGGAAAPAAIAQPIIAGAVGMVTGQVIQFSLNSAAPEADGVRQLHGTVRVAVAKGTGQIQFDDPLDSKGKTLEKEGVRVTLKSVRLEDQRLEIKLVAEGDAIIYPSGVFAIDSEGKESRLRQTMGMVFNTGNGRGTHEYSGQIEGVPAPPRAIVFRFPVGREEKEIPFEFHDIPLP